MCVCEMIRQSLAQGQREGSSLAGTVGERSMQYTVIHCSILFCTVILYCGVL